MHALSAMHICMCMCAYMPMIFRERLEDIQVAIRVRINGEAQCDSTKAWQSSNSGGIRIVSGNEPHQAPTNGFPIIGGVSDQVQVHHSITTW